MPLITKAYLGSTKLFREKSWFEDMSQKPVNDSGAVTVTANTSAHTKGSWTELIASTSANASYLLIEVSGVAAIGADTATLLDIATGGSGSEVVLIGDIAVGSAATAAGTQPSFTFGVPIKVASGARLSARIQSVVTGGKTATVQISTFDMGDYSYAPTAVDVIGTSTATSVGTAMSGSSGTWVQITASTSNAYRAVVVVPSASAIALATIIPEFRLGTGASGAESEVGRMFAAYTNAETAGILARTSALITGSIPSGTRLSVRHTIAASPGNYDVTLIGIR